MVRMIQEKTHKEYNDGTIMSLIIFDSKEEHLAFKLLLEKIDLELKKQESNG